MDEAEIVKYGTEVIKNPGVQRLIGNTLGAPIAEAAAWFATEVRYHRFMREVKLWTRAHQMLEDAGLDAKPIGPVDLSIVMPLLESGSLVEDEQLSEKWAALLAAAARGDDRVHPSFPDILRQLTPMEAAILDQIHGDAGETWVTSPYEPYIVAERAGFPIRGAHGEPIELPPHRTVLSNERLNLAVDNLLRLSLVKRPETYGTIAGQSLKGGPETKVVLTSLGHSFVVACRPPAPA